MIPPVSAWMHSKSFVGMLLGLRGKMESFSRAWRCDCKLWPRFLDDPVLICSSSSANTRRSAGDFCFSCWRSIGSMLETCPMLEILIRHGGRLSSDVAAELCCTPTPGVGKERIKCGKLSDRSFLPFGNCTRHLEGPMRQVNPNCKN